MGDFIRDGGFGMYPILILGGLTLLVAGYYGARTDPKVRAVLRAMTRSLAYFTCAATVLDVAAVLTFVTRSDGPVLDDRAGVVLLGLRESLHPAILGFAILAVAHLLAAAGERTKLSVS